MRRATVQFLATALIALAVALVYAPAWVPRYTFSGMDFLTLLYPHGVLVKRAFLTGEFPLWNWYSWGGSPLLAAMQAGALYPPMWAALCLPLPHGLQVFNFAHLVWAGVGVCFVGRRLFGLPWIPSAYAGVAFACGAFLFGHIEQTNSVAAISWTPWILGAVALTSPSAVGTGWIAGSVALALLAGHPQYVVLAVMFAVVFRAMVGAAAAWSGSRGGAVPARASTKGAAATAGSLFGGLALAGALAAMQLLPTHELSGLSERVWQYPNPVDPSLRWIFLPALFTPRFYNHLSNSPGQPLGFSELGLYCGILSFALFLVGVASIVRNWKPRNFALLSVWALSLLFSLGDEGGLARAAMRIVPLLGASRGAARGLAFETVAYALIAGHGLAAGLGGLAARAGTRRMRATRIWGCSALVILVADLTLTHRQELEHRLIQARLLRMPVASLDRFDLPPATAPRLHRFMANDSDLYLDQAGDAVLQRRFRLQPNLNALESLRLTDGYEEGLVPPRHYANFLRRFNRNLRSDKPDEALLALMGAGCIMTEYPITDVGPGWEADGPAAYYFGTTYRFFKPGLAPRGAWFLDAQALGPAVRGDWDAGWWGATVGRGADGAPAREAAGRAGAAAHPADWVSSATLARAASLAQLLVVEMRTNSLSVESPNAEGRRLLFLQSWYPGWLVRGEGAGARMRTPGAVLAGGMMLPKSPVFSEFGWESGWRRARVEYRPFSFLLGGFVTLVGLGGWLAVVVGRAKGLMRGRDNGNRE